MQALGLVFERMLSLETVNIKNCINPFKKHSGLKFIIQGLIKNKKTLRKVDISGNSYNSDKICIENLEKLILECVFLRNLNISSLGLNKQGCKKIIEVF